MCDESKKSVTQQLRNLSRFPYAGSNLVKITGVGEVKTGKPKYLPYYYSDMLTGVPLPQEGGDQYPESGPGCASPGISQLEPGLIPYQRTSSLSTTPSASHQTNIHRGSDTPARRMKPEKSSRKGKKQKEIGEKVKALDAELMSFYDFCEKMGFSPEEMDTICSPLNDVMTKNGLTRVAKGCIALLFIFGVVYAVANVAPFAAHSTALGRIALIKLLSFWDWRHLFNEPCLVENPMYGDYGLTPEDCMSCEAIDSIHVISRTSYKALTEDYFSRDAPVIISDGTSTWDIMNAPLTFDNITKLYFEDRKMYDTVPCVLTTNLRQGGPDLSSFLKIISNDNIKKWFVHWQNCDINAVKALRKFYERPYFLPSTMSPAHFNWIFMSSDYTSMNYKKLDLDFGLIMFIQLRGRSLVRIIPFKPCNETCSDLTATIQQGEILVLKNYLWTLEYLPGSGTDNIAVLTETAWDQSAA